MAALAPKKNRRMEAMNLEFSESYREDLSSVCTYIKESVSTTQHQSINKVHVFRYKLCLHIN